MTDSTSVTEGTLTPPWSADARAHAKDLCAELGAEGVAVGVIDPAHPKPDQILVAHGLDESALIDWCGGGYQQDALLAHAMQAGAASTPRQSADALTGLVGDLHALTVMSPQCLEVGRWWWLLAVRRGDAFESEQVRLTDRLLRKWTARFALPLEPTMGRMIVGRNNRPIALDLGTAQKLIRQPGLIDDVLAKVRPVLQQRYPDLPLDQTVDLAIRLDNPPDAAADSQAQARTQSGTPYWVWARRSRALDTPDAERWHFELRPLSADELPVAGVVEDDRVAHAIAYLHAHYHESPNLADVARQAHMSPFHFHRVFNRQVGVTPKHYLQSKQLQMAKWFLRSSRTPIGAISHDTGFSSHGHFTSTFHRLVGVSPSQYREMGWGEE